MMMSYTTHSDHFNDSRVSAIAGNVDAARIPGRISVLGGWSIGVFENSALKDEAFEFIKWLVSPEMAVPNTVLGGFIPTNTLYDNLELTTIYPWLRQSFDVFEDAIPRKLPLAADGKCVSERLVEDIVGHAVHEAIIRAITPEEALENAERALVKAFGY